ncbi:protocatechuate 3,4-dioxygenase [Altererythrobacter sp. ZODW24]|uniref:protocatechuate 3,4-dioxygenase n=1 Tax=Altererythrobacter sp. ZODW24 TaxID=2185142 RepID=UPI000DF7CD9B|nr:protocatechuate 3,4-dioxygenase [Altererythrobacter sp. ZODW24]
MDSFKKNLSRRAFAGSALAAGTFVATRGMAQNGPPALTPESPLGRFYPANRKGDDDFDMTKVGGGKEVASGEIIEIRGRIVDRNGQSIRRATVDIWQANAAGRYTHDNEQSTAPIDEDFQGFARLETNTFGDWNIKTIKPGVYETPKGLRAPHIHFEVTGFSHRLSAQLYFPDHAEQNAADPFYIALGDSAPASVARMVSPGQYRWDIVLMDERE